MNYLKEIEKSIERAKKLLENAQSKLVEEKGKGKPTPLEGYKMKYSGVIEGGDYLWYSNRWDPARRAIGEQVGWSNYDIVCTPINKSIPIPEGYEEIFKGFWKPEDMWTEKNNQYSWRHINFVSLSDIKEHTSKRFIRPIAKKEDIKAGYGYYLLKNGDLIISGDELIIKDLKWYNSNNITYVDLKNGIKAYRRKVFIPEGWELVSENEYVKRWDKCFNIRSKTFVNCDPFPNTEANKYMYAVIRKIEPKIVVPEGYYIENDPEYIIQENDLVVSKITSLSNIYREKPHISLGKSIRNCKKYWDGYYYIEIARPIKHEPTIEEMNREVSSFLNTLSGYGSPNYYLNWGSLITALQKVYLDTWQYHIIEGDITKTFKHLYNFVIIINKSK